MAAKTQQMGASEAGAAPEQPGQPLLHAQTQQEPNDMAQKAAEAVTAVAAATLEAEMQAAATRPRPADNSPQNQPVSSYEALVSKLLGHAEGASHIFIASMATFYASWWLLSPGGGSGVDSAPPGWLWWLTGWMVRPLVIGPGLALLVTAIVLTTSHRRYIDTYRRNIKADLQRSLFSERLVTDNPLDRESTEWLNHILHRFWLIFEPVMSEIVVATVDPILEYYAPSTIDGIRLSEFTLGTVAPRVLWAKSYPCAETDQIRFDMAVSFVPAPPDSLCSRKGERNSRIVLTTRIGRGIVGVDVPVLVSDMAFEGELKIQLQTMNGFPFIKLASIQFPSSPHIDFTLKPLKGMDLMDLPGLSSFVHSITRDIVGWLFVAPNAFTLDIDALLNGEGSWAGNETACGVLMIRVIEAKDLKNLERTGFSDPYVDINVRGRSVANTRVISSNLNPYWNETFYVLVHSLEDAVEWVVYDKEGTLKDKVIGAAGGSMIDLGFTDDNTTGKRVEDIWLSLSGVEGKRERWKVKDISGAKSHTKPKGEIHLDLAYYPVLQPLPLPPSTASSQAGSGQVAVEAASLAAAGSNIHEKAIWAGILRVTVHQAKELDESRAVIGQLHPFVEISLGTQVVHATKPKKRTSNPAWGDLVELFIRHPASEKVRFTVRDKREFGDAMELGHCDITVAEILKMLGLSVIPHQKRDANAPSPKIIEWFTLRGAKFGKLRVTFTYTHVPFDHPLPTVNESGFSFTPAIGVLRLKVVEARGLKNQEVTGLSDPYVNVLYSGQIRGRTHVAESTLEPLWHEVMHILIRDSSLRGLLTFEVFDYNNLKNDKLMGKAHYDLKQMNSLSYSDVINAWLPVMLDNGKKQVGEIRVELSYYPSAESLAARDRTASFASTLKTLDGPPDNSAPKAESVKAVVKKPLLTTGILRVNVRRIELDPKAVVQDGYSDKSPPFPYLEFLDTRGAITGNEVATLSDTNNLKLSSGDSSSELTAGKGVKSTKSAQALAQMLMADGDERRPAISADQGATRLGRDIVLLYRSRALEGAFSGSVEEDLEFFVKDLESARLVVLCKDGGNAAVKKDGAMNVVAGVKDAAALVPGLITAQNATKHAVLGKTELNIKSVLTKNTSESASLANIVVDAVGPRNAPDGAAKSQPVEDWYKVFALNLDRPSIIGKFQLSLAFAEVPLDEQLLMHDQDAEAMASGTIRVTVVSAENLPALDSSSTSDPYCKVSLNNAQLLKTKVVKKNCLNPRWNESCSATCTNRLRSRVFFDVRDWEKVGQDRRLGMTHIDCIDIAAVDEKPTTMALELMDEGGAPVYGSSGAASKLFVEVSFVPDSDSVARSRHLSRKRSLPTVAGAVEDAIGAVGAVGLAAKRFVNSARPKHHGGKKEGTAAPQEPLFSAPSASESENSAPKAELIDVNIAESSLPAPNMSAKPLASSYSQVAVTPIIGSLTITVVEAKNLKAVDSNGYSDPYVKVRYFSTAKQQHQQEPANNGSKNRIIPHSHGGFKLEKVLYKTKVMKKSLNPVWNETFTVPFPVSPAEGPLSLNFCIKDHNKIGGGVEIGESDIDVWKLVQAPASWSDNQTSVTADIWTEPLHGGGEGTLRLKLEFSKSLESIKHDSLARSGTSVLSMDGNETSGGEETHRKWFGIGGHSGSRDALSD